MARDLKFRIYKEEVLYYPDSKNKDADQLRDYREADLRLCFCICKRPVFSQLGSFYSRLISCLGYERIMKEVVMFYKGFIKMYWNVMWKLMNMILKVPRRPTR